MFETDFVSMLSEYGDAVSDRNRFSALVRDYFPGQPMQINLILSAYELGIAGDIRTASRINNTFAYRYVKRLMDEHGISRANADWAVAMWCVCYGRHILGKPCEIRLPSPGVAHGPVIQEEKPGVVTYGDLFCYVKSDTGSGLAVSGFTGDSVKTIIFQNVSRGKPVTGVLEEAFAESEIEEAIFTEGFRVIGKKAFYGCAKLSQAIFPESLRELGDYSFAGCSYLSLAVIPPYLEKIGDYALSGTGLRSIEIPGSLYWIGEGAFSGCCGLTKMEIPENIQELPDKIFSGCKGLRRVLLHERLESIGAHAFDGCADLEDISIPDSVSRIGDGAFDNTHEKFILMCGSGSYAESYARKNRIRYQLI